MTHDTAATTALAPWLRRRVATLRVSTRGRYFATVVEVVDVPAAGAEPAFAAWRHDGQSLDRGLRVDLISRLWVALGSRSAVVVVRSGDHGTRSDEDAEWLGAAREAADIVGRELAAVVLVSRWGWFDLLSGNHREWRRLRIRAR